MAIRRPSSSGIRGPQAGMKNDNIMNPPRYSEQGGLTSPGSIKPKSEINIEPPNRGRGSGLPSLPRGQE